MLYVAGEILIWMLLAFLLGIALGWAIWGLRSRQEAERHERETQQRLAAAQQDTDRARLQAQEVAAARSRDAETIARLQAVAAASDAASASDATEAARLRHQVADLQAQLASAVEERAEAEQRAGAAEDILEDHDGWEPVGEIPGLEEAQETLGRPVILDDLKVVEGIGPQVEEVLQSAGITNWAALANSNPAALRDILDAAGPDYTAHDPSTWPQQAVLAIGGHWHTLRSLQDSLRGGRA
jgi:predicted flap endonuclease-1-like 5' DNA nuclease